MKKSGSIFRRIFRGFCRFVETKCPEKIRGETQILERKLSIKYDGERLSAAIRSYQRKNVIFYMIVFIGVIAAAAIVSISSAVSRTTLDQISRPEHGAGQKVVPVAVEAVKDGISVEGTANITIREEELDEAQKDRILSEFAEKLPDLVVPRSGDVRIVTEDFSLPVRDGEYGISISWESSDPVLISKDGKYDVLALADEEESVRLTAALTYEGREKEISFDVVLRDDASLYQASISRKVQEIVDEISMSQEKSEITLPSQIDDISLKWMKYDTDGLIWIFLLGIVLTLAVFFRRYFFAEREARRYRQGIVKYFPPFIDKLVLLLNSGLTVMTAMEKIAEDCRVTAEYDKKNMLAYEAAQIGKRVKEMNSSVVKEWRKFASRTGINEIMRFSTIIEDNIGKGTSLAEKLEIESNLLRDREKKSMQEKMRMIDTKLTLPMMLMLFSLVLVTVAPAMMQMQG